MITSLIIIYVASALIATRFVFYMIRASGEMDVADFISALLLIGLPVLNTLFVVDEAAYKIDSKMDTVLWRKK